MEGELLKGRIYDQVAVHMLHRLKSAVLKICRS